MLKYITSGVVMLIVGGIMGLLLAVASKKFKVKEDPRLEKVTSLLPGYNCGACGETGCAGLANSLITKKTDFILCKPIKEDKRKEIIKYLAETPGPDGETVIIK